MPKEPIQIKFKPDGVWLYLAELKQAVVLTNEQALTLARAVRVKLGD